MIYQEGPPHKRTYIMGVEKGSSDPLDPKNPRENCVGFGIGNSKKEGQQNAAKMALIIYGSLNNDQFENSDIFYPDWEKIDSCLENESENYLINTETSESSQKKSSKKGFKKSKKKSLEDDSLDLQDLQDLENMNEVIDDGDDISELSDETDSDEE